MPDPCWKSGSECKNFPSKFTSERKEGPSYETKPSMGILLESQTDRNSQDYAYISVFVMLISVVTDRRREIICNMYALGRITTCCNQKTKKTPPPPPPAILQVSLGGEGGGGKSCKQGVCKNA